MAFMSSTKQGSLPTNYEGKYLQAYLDEFCYKLYRKYFGEWFFNKLIMAISNKE